MSQMLLHLPIPSEQFRNWSINISRNALLYKDYYHLSRSGVTVTVTCTSSSPVFDLTRLTNHIVTVESLYDQLLSATDLSSKIVNTTKLTPPEMKLKQIKGKVKAKRRLKGGKTKVDKVNVMHCILLFPIK